MEWNGMDYEYMYDEKMNKRKTYIAKKAEMGPIKDILLTQYFFSFLRSSCCFYIHFVDKDE